MNRVVFTTVGRPQIKSNAPKGSIKVDWQGTSYSIELVKFTETAPIVFSAGGELGLSEGEYVFFLPEKLSDAAVEKIVLKAIGVSTNSDITRSIPTPYGTDPFI